jgi:predicted DsbA family dithiol-disulfide isomerase
MRVEIWSDIVCPWCYIGKRRFETALSQFDHANEVDVVWKSFQLDPDQPKGKPEPVAEHLAAKYGVSVDEARAMNDRVKGIAAEEGLAYDFDRYTMVNTFDAHRLTHLAKEHGLGAELHERLLRAQLVEGEVLEDPDTLVRLAVEVGIPEADARRVVESDAYTNEVNADIDELRGLGGNGVPFFVIDRRYGVSGAQPAELFLNALETAYQESAPAATGR